MIRQTFTSSTAFVSAICVLAACGPSKLIRPTSASPSLPAVNVSADFDRTWDASIAWLASNTVQIKSNDKSTGLIVAEIDGPVLRNRTPVLDASGKATRAVSPPVYADCGTADGVPYDITKAEFNLHVMRQATGATVQVSARFTNDGSGVGNSFFVCPSTLKWEKDAAEFIRSRAEGK